METQSNPTKQQVVFFAQRSTLLRYLVLYIAMIVAYVWIIMSYFFQFGSLGSSSPSLLPLFALLILLTLILVVALGRILILIVHKLAYQDFTLVLNHEGITTSPVTAMNKISLSWAEIGTLSTRRVSFFNYFCIYPKDLQQLLKRFGPVRRILLRLTTLRTGTPLNVPGWFFSVPVDQILLQVLENFGDELRTHEIQVKLQGGR